MLKIFQKKITIDRVTQSNDIKAGMYIDLESDETTHFSIADKFGNLVSTTYTLNSSQIQLCSKNFVIQQ